MCGISGIISLNGGDVATHIGTMTDIIRYRGPDDEGFAHISSKGEVYLHGGKDTPAPVYKSKFSYTPSKKVKVPFESLVSLGHRRLSIVDLSPAGHQPMTTEDGRYIIVYNGEIYNHIELRKELEGKGYKFKSANDTEVILCAYQEWGKECLHKFNGMFAFILYDREEKLVFVARDRFGIKPVYYWFSPEGFVAIASEIKQFTTLPGWKAKLNHQKAFDFLVYGISDHDNETKFKGVFQLRPGECFECSVDDIKDSLPVERWYELKSAKVDMSFKDATKKFKELFFDSVLLRLRADVEVGTGLSGGMDSSSIVCTVNEMLRKSNDHSKQNTFSACSHEKKFDEREYIDEVVSHTDVKAHYIYPELKDLFKEMEKITWHQDEPFAGTSIFASWSVFKLVEKTDVKVTLDGQGSDETMYGYHLFYSVMFCELIKGLKFGRLLRESRAIKNMHGKNNYMLKALTMLMPSFVIRLARKLYKGPLARGSYINTSYDINLQGVNKVIENFSSSLKRNSIARLMDFSLPVYLHWLDRNSMAHSIESRTPFLDYRLVEFILGCPDEYKLNEGLTKRILREAMDGVLPDKIKDRISKLGFVTPEEVWVQNQQPELFREKVKQAIKQSKGFISDDAMQIAEEIISGKRPYDEWIWRVINFGKWMEVYSVELQ